MGENMESEAPLLLMSHGKSLYEKHLTYSISENSFKVLDDIPILRDKEVFGSSYGWLILVDFEVIEDLKSHCYLWNPITMAIIQLPQLNRPWNYTKCILSKPPTEPDCHVLFNSIINQSFCRIGDEEFVELEKQKEDDTLRQLSAIGSFQGQIYGLMDPGHRFVTLHFVGRTLEFRPIMLADEPLRFPQLSAPVLRYSYLIESPPDGTGGEVELLTVLKIYRSIHFDGGVEFRVFRIDTSQMTCTELDNIGNRAIFLGHRDGGFCRCSSGKIKPNSIYYTDRYGRSVHVFDLDDGSTTSMLTWRGAGYKSMTSWVHQQIFQNYIDH